MVTKEEYWRRKSAGLCVKCGKDVPIFGSVLCLECNLKQIKYNVATRSKDGYKDKQNATRKALFAKRKELCLCRCGRKVSDKNHTTCLECRIRGNRYSYLYKERTGKIKHILYTDKCIWCGGERLEGRKFCEDCLKRKQEIMANNRALKEMK